MSTCTQCKGLIMEPNKAYGYAGKVCICGWMNSNYGQPTFPTIPKGWKLVPEEPTKEFLGKPFKVQYTREQIDKFEYLSHNGHYQHTLSGMDLYEVYKMIISAAPTPPEEEKSLFTKAELKEGDRVTFCKSMGLQDGIVTKDENGYMTIKPEERE